MTPDQGRPVSHAEGAERWFCKDCGSPLAAQYDYLPDQIYIPIGLLDQAAELGPKLHAHTGSRLPWLHLDDDLTKIDASSRAALQEKSSHG